MPFFFYRRVTIFRRPVPRSMRGIFPDSTAFTPQSGDRFLFPPSDEPGNKELWNAKLVVRQIFSCHYFWFTIENHDDSLLPKKYGEKKGTHGFIFLGRQAGMTGSTDPNFMRRSLDATHKHHHFPALIRRESYPCLVSFFFSHFFPCPSLFSPVSPLPPTKNLISSSITCTLFFTFLFFIERGKNLQTPFSLIPSS